MPIKATTELPDAQTPTAGNGVENELSVAWADVTDYGEYRVQWRETSKSEWNLALTSRTLLADGTALSAWSDGANGTVSQVASPTESGSAIRVDAAAAGGSDYDTGGWLDISGQDLSGDDYLQVWLYNGVDAADFQVFLSDGTNGYFAGVAAGISAGKAELVQVPLQQFADNGVDLAGVQSLKIALDTGTTEGDEWFVIDSLLSGVASVGQATTSLIVPYLEDGEEYEARLRTETEHVTGAWSPADSVVTNFPGVQNLQIAAVDTTSVDLQFDEVSDNEDGVLVLRRQRYGESWGEWREVADIGPYPGDDATQTYTESTPRPDREYEWKLQPYTEDTSVESGAVSATTDSLGLAKRPIPPSGWHVEVERPDGRVFSPTLAADAEWVPRTNALPKVRIPVEKSDRWMTKNYENRPMTVYKDGERLPIERLEVANRKEDRVVLEGRGGLELLGRTQVNYRNTPVHEAAAEVVTQDTTYATNFDAPDTTQTSGTSVQSTDTEDEWRNALSDHPFESTSPFYVGAGGSLRTHKTAHFVDATDMEVTAITGGTELQGGDDFYAGSTAVRFDGINEERQATITLDYDHPNGTTAGFRIRYDDSVDQGMQECSLYVDGTEVASYDTGDRPIVLQSEEPPYWFTFEVGSLDAGDHTLKMQTGSTYDDTIDHVVLDCVALVDDDHESLPTDGDVVSNGNLQGRSAYPTVQTQTNNVVTVKQVIGGQLESSFNSTANGQEVAISNDSGANWLTAANSETVDGEFSGATNTLRARFTLSSYNSGGGLVEYDAGQTVDLYDLLGDLEDIPTLRDRAPDATTLSVLQDWADYAGAVFEVTRRNGETTVEWTHPGQRSEGLAASVESHSVEKSTEQQYDMVVVKGTGTRRRGKAFTANHGSLVALPDAHFIRGSEVVYDPGDGTQFERNSDYEMNYLDGEIETLATGDMTDGTTYEVDYRSRVTGSYQIGSGSNPKTLVETLPQLSTPESCDQAAYYLAQQSSQPQVEATLTIDDIDPGQSVVASLDLPEEVAAGLSGPWVPDNISNRSSGTEVRLNSRSDMGELLADIRDRLSGVEGQA